MAFESGSEQPSWLARNWKTVLALGLILVLGAFFRIGFNFEPAINDGNPRFAGNDDYYHLRVVQHVLEEGEHLERDPLLNYPVGANNPRPPLYDWHVAVVGRVIELTTGMDSDLAAAYALEWGSAFWGVLTVIPVWLIGRSIWSNRAGLWGAFLLAASPAHIQRSGFGLGDHDAFIIFFLVLGIYFLLRAFQQTRDDVRVRSWRSLRSIAEGISSYADHHRDVMAYAFLAGVCWATIAVAWEGFAYVTAIYAVYYGFQLLANHLRRRDSVGDALIMLLAVGPMVLLGLPYYWSMGNLGLTVNANAYILAGMTLMTLALVPTRDVPAVVVLPSVAGIGVATWAFLTFVVPDIGQQVFSANGYFLQSKLYSTIAEAQRTELGVFVFSIGFMTFFLALTGFVWATIRFFKHRDRDLLFLVAWGLISIYMAFAAARFVFNAAPVFCVLGGWMVAKLMGWMNWRERWRDFRAVRHESWGKAVKSITGARQVAGSLFLVFTLILPNVWFSFDAGFPSEVRANYRQNHPGNDFVEKQTGAFGQGFLAPDWIEAYDWLSRQDAGDDPDNPIPCEDRPGHMAWWDYGFWEANLGCHPTVADNFQNGVDIAARALTAESERELMEYHTVRLLEGDSLANKGPLSPAVAAALASTNASLPAAMPPLVSRPQYDEVQAVLHAQFNSSNENENLDRMVDLYLNVSAATRTSISYFLVDIRMLPLDDPRTTRIESGSIFYAPVFLANKNPDRYVQTVYQDVNNQTYRVVGYRTDSDGVSHQIVPPLIIDEFCQEYRVNFTVDSSCRLYFTGSNNIVRTLDGKRIDYGHAGGDGTQLRTTLLEFLPDFYKTMFYRAYVGGDGNPPPFEQNYHPSQPGNDLRHWRTVYMTEDSNPVRLLKFFRGAELAGRVSFDLGDGTTQPIGDATIEVVDEFGARHDGAATNATGDFRVLLPFSTYNETSQQLNNVTVRVLRNGVLVAEHGFQVTERQAMRQDPWEFDHEFVVEPGSLEVFAWVDRNRDGRYNATLDGRTVDRPLPQAIIDWEAYSAVANETGNATFARVMPGGDNNSGGFLEGYRATPKPIAVRPGERTSTNISFQYEQVAVNGTLQLENGTAVSGIPINVTAVNAAADFTRDAPQTNSLPGGNFTSTVTPGGSYRFSVDFMRVESNGTVNATYRGEVVLNVPAPDQPGWQATITMAEPLRVTRTEG